MFHFVCLSVPLTYGHCVFLRGKDLFVPFKIMVEFSKVGVFITSMSHTSIYEDTRLSL